MASHFSQNKDKFLTMGPCPSSTFLYTIFTFSHHSPSTWSSHYLNIQTLFLLLRLCIHWSFYWKCFQCFLSVPTIALDWLILILKVWHRYHLLRKGFPDLHLGWPLTATVCIITVFLKSLLQSIITLILCLLIFSLFYLSHYNLR